jgi:hypothetical protein
MSNQNDGAASSIHERSSARPSILFFLFAIESGRPVGGVELPRWARGSPAFFLATMRAALEAPSVSASLHRWIDLVFGCRQRG